jgi:hypothetical protein
MPGFYLQALDFVRISAQIHVPAGSGCEKNCGRNHKKLAKFFIFITISLVIAGLNQTALFMGSGLDSQRKDPVDTRA